MKKPWLAGVLSFIFPGIGQFYTRKYILGIAFILGYLLTLILGSTGSVVLTLLFVIGMPSLWLISIFHAVFATRNFNTVHNQN